jgi:hypothetical protein
MSSLDTDFPFYKLALKNNNEDGQEVEETDEKNEANSKKQSFSDYYNDPNNYGHGL